MRLDLEVTVKRYIVVGYRDQVREWRRERGLSESEVWPVHYRSEALRGLDGNKVEQVVLLPAFWDWPADEQRRVLTQVSIVMRPEIRRPAA